MIDEDHLKHVRISERSAGQRIVGYVFLMPNYNLPPRTEIILEGVSNLPTGRTVMFAMNHTDRYNYWPFQYQMWRRGDLPFTTTWVKGKYYENKALGWFFDQCNNIPLPSRGYLIFQDGRLVLDRKLDDGEYRVLRDLVDGKLAAEDALRDAEGDLLRLLTEPRRDFDPEHEPYADYLHRWNDRLMGLVESRTLEALGPKHNNVIVFPQGTRSVRLLPGKPGLAQFALRHRVPVVPVGSMGSEHVYPTGNPVAKGGRIVYRIGEPMTVEDAFADCVIDEPYTPFTREAEQFRDRFERATERITMAINDLLDEPYQLAPDGDDADRPRAERFL